MKPAAWWHWQTFLHWNKLELGVSHLCRMSTLQLYSLLCAECDKCLISCTRMRGCSIPEALTYSRYASHTHSHTDVALPGGLTCLDLKADIRYYWQTHILDDAMHSKDYLYVKTPSLTQPWHVPTQAYALAFKR